MKNTDKTNTSNKLTNLIDGTHYSKEFDESYFHTKSDNLQSDFVFIQQNEIKRRLAESKQTFTIVETGSSLGLNFLLTLQAYQKAQQASMTQLAPLHFICIEKSPVTKETLILALTKFPQLQELTQLLIEHYPEVSSEKVPQEHKVVMLNGQVNLTLLFNDTTQALSSLKSLKKGVIDVWYFGIDSFTKEIPLLSKALFSHIGRLSKEQATITSLTTVDLVKEGLFDVGFQLQSLPLEKNKTMLYGIMQNNPLTNKGYQLRPRIKKPEQVTIVGGGIASACAAYALTKQGVNVTLYCKDTSVAQGGSSNAIGALYPLLHQQSDDMSCFYQQAFWRAKALYTEVSEQGFLFPHQWCGLLEVSYKDALINRQQAFEKLNTWPKSLIHGVNNIQASKAAGIDLPYGGLFMPNAGWISPQELVQQIFKAAEATHLLEIITETHITKIQQVVETASQSNTVNASTSKRNKTSWLLSSNKGELSAGVLVICAGADSIEIEQLNTLPLTATRGQITSMKSNSTISKLSTVICHKGYLTPKNKGIHCIGATFQKNDTNLETNKEDNQYNLAMLKKCMPELSADIDWQEQDISSSKARLRCMSRDHLPLVGGVPNVPQHIEAYPHLAKDKNWSYSQPTPYIDNLYVLLGLGARGLCSAPLAADILTADLCNTPYPIDNQMLFNLSPNRFIIRDIIKRKIPE